MVPCPSLVVSFFLISTLKLINDLPFPGYLFIREKQNKSTKKIMHHS